MANRYNRKIEDVNHYHFQYDPKSNPKYVVITMRDNARLYLPKDNVENSYANIKKQLNKHFRLWKEQDKEFFNKKDLNK